VLFDATDTLFAPYPSVGGVYARVAADFGIGLDACAIDASFAEDFRRTVRELRSRGLAVWENESAARAFWRRLLDVIFLRLAGKPCAQDCFQAIYHAFATAGAWRVFPDVLPALKLLQGKGLQLGIVSNFDERLFSIVNALGLQKHFRLVLPSTDAGVAKPDRRIFLKALRRLGARPTQALYVGDDPEADAAGAQAAGMQWLLVDREKRLPASDGVIHSLAEIQDRIEDQP
jgi:putative hydrolase of the HAD superfamily